MKSDHIHLTPMKTIEDIFDYSLYLYLLMSFNDYLYEVYFFLLFICNSDAGIIY